MKRNFPKRLVSLIIAAAVLITVPAMASGRDEGRYVNSTALSDFFTYTNSIDYTAYGRTESFALELKKGGDIQQIITSCDTIYGGMTVQNVVKYAEDQGYNVLAAVNTDFFSMLNRVPMGIVIENGIYKSSPSGRNAVCIDPSGGTSVTGGFEVTMTLENYGGVTYSEMSNAGQKVTVEHFNKYRTDTALYLYSDDFSTVSTRAESDGWAVRFKVLSGELTVNSTLQLQVEEVLSNVAGAAIGNGYMVLTAAAVAHLDFEAEKFAVGDAVTLTTTCSDLSISNAKWASGCGDLLVSEGAITDSEGWDKSISEANPRTAVGIKPDGSVIYYVVDGRQGGYSRGATLSELAIQLLSMGCEYAANLDGGGSSVMSVRMPGNESSILVNSPSDGAARRCGTYVLFVTENNSNKVARRLFLKNDGEIVLAGSSFNLSFAAMDSAYRNVQVPVDLKPSAALGKFSNGVYTAGQKDGTDTISLHSTSTGSSGKGTVHVITTPSEITVSDGETGTVITNLNPGRGDTVQLSVKAKYLGRLAHSNPEAFSFSVEGEIGSVTGDGVFTAGARSNLSGNIIISVGELSYVIPVAIPPEPEDTDGHWSEEYVVRLWKAGIVNGVTDTAFDPNGLLKRCDFILMLYRAAGEPYTDTETTFSDVPADAYYTEAVKWAEANGIAKGTDEGLFEPSKTLIREQGFTFIYRYLLLTGLVDDSSVGADLSTFSDISMMSEYAVLPVSVLVGLGIVGGSDGQMTPLSTMTRGQMAKVLSLAAGI